MAKARFAINIDDGRIVFRTTATDALKALYRNISDDVAKAIDSGDVTTNEVINAIMSEERYNGTFDWKEFEKSRKALNMRTTKFDLNDTEEEATDKIPDDEPGTVISLDKVKKTEKKKTVKKEVEEKASAVPSEFPFK